jgi:hypothetical protein
VVASRLSALEASFVEALIKCMPHNMDIRLEGGENVLRSVKILTYTFTLKAIHFIFHVAVKYHNVLNLEMVVI